MRAAPGHAKKDDKTEETKQEKTPMCYVVFGNGPQDTADGVPVTHGGS